MSQYTVKRLIEALDRPSTMSALRRKTDLNTAQLLATMLEARAAGYRIVANQRTGAFTYYTKEDTNGTND